MRARAGLGGALIAGLAAAGAASAAADFGPPSLLTVSPLEQADGVASSALSADGRYLVFSGSLDGIKGVLRRDLATGLTEVVAAAGAYGTAPVLDASDPSTSADGRFVSFTTTAALDPVDDTNTAADVYVRDMEASVPADGAPCDPGGPCAYSLASAADGSAAGLSYDGAAGSHAAPRSALSADGRRVAFVVGAGSDLAGPGTPAGQVAVRDLDTRRTTLVSSARDVATGAMTGRPVPGGAVTAGYAALSADGTTVAWSGAHIALQAAIVGGDPAGSTDAYNEPLWRRIADGPGAPTRRVAGAGDPEAPGCPAGGTMADPDCRGPYPDLPAASPTDDLQGGWLARPSTSAALPALSADGRTVAFAGGPPTPPRFAATVVSDLFVSDMRAGLARRQAVRRLTQELDTVDPRLGVSDLAIAPDGRRIAFATGRVTFPLAPPFLVGAPPAQPDLPELYLVDLDGQSLQRISTTTDGGPSTLGPAGPAPGTPTGPMAPSFDASGRMLAFDSPARNLVAVDANQANDAFLVEDHPAPVGTPGRVDIGPPPAAPQVARAWRVALRAVAQRDGSVRLDADCPGAGVLRATVQATVPVWRTVKVRKRGGGHRSVRRRILAKRQVAVASMVVRGGGLSRLSVRATKAYKSLVAGKAGLDATAKVTFAAPARATLRDTLALRFRIVAAKTKKAKARR
jgi:hypothetical protein